MMAFINPKKILVIQQKMIGDVLISSLLCDNLRKAYPTSQIDYLVYQSTTDVLQGNKSFDNLVIFQQKHRESLWEFFKLLLNIRKTKYDLVIDAYSKIESWLPVMFSGAKQKISYYKKGFSVLYTDTVHRKNEITQNVIDDRLSLLNPLKFDIELETFPKIYVSEQENDFARTLFKSQNIDINKKTIMMSIIGSSENKTYPLGYMSKLIDFVADERDVNILFNYFPKQILQAEEIFDNCKEETKRKIYFSVLGKNIREFIAIMNNCDVIIGNDGGAINMAKAIEKPSFIIFSPWIDKKGWATFEDRINHVSVHLQELKPELFEEKSTKFLKENHESLYKKFTPEFIYPLLKKFIQQHL